MFTRKPKVPECDGSVTCNCMSQTFKEIQREMQRETAFREMQRQISRLEAESKELIKIISKLSGVPDEKV